MGWRVHPAWPQEQFRQWLCVEGAVWLREQDSSSAGPGAQGSGDTAQDPALPLGQKEAGGTQGSKDALATRQP